jgi:hypothetical protein
MASESALEIYEQRSQIAEFPHVWIKEKFGLRKFRLHGMIKVRRKEFQMNPVSGKWVDRLRGGPTHQATRSAGGI